jgi:hypothetical protein
MRTRKSTCHPKIHSTKSCFKPNILKKINKQITKKKNPLVRSCKNEMCIIDTVFNKRESSKMKKKLFAPTAPKSWEQDTKVWLDGQDIYNVMRQYEEANNSFLFLGPSPIDFDRKYIGETNCVYNKLCNFSITRCLKTKKTKIGIIFNTDPITKNGKHWIAMYIDLKKKYIFFFDSNGTNIPKELQVFRDRVIKDAQQNNIKLKYISNYKFPHQTTDGQCGMYCIYVLINLITKREPSYFLKNKITDKMMVKHRNIYYNTSI